MQATIWPKWSAARRLVFSLILLSSATISRAQQGTDSRIIEEARRLRDRGDSPAAIAVLTPYVGGHPDDVLGARTLAQLLYWSQALPAARDAYESALSRHPRDISLRLDYGRMLVETRNDARLQSVVAPLLDDPDARVWAASLLGTAAYWRGDLTTARRDFEIALAADSALTDVRRDLVAIRALTTPWIRLTTEYRHDNQPVNRPSGGLEVGWYPTPLTTLSIGGDAGHSLSGDSISLNSTRASVRLTHFAPAAHTDFEIAAGGIQRSAGLGNDWIARLALGFHLPQHLVVKLAAERSDYANTLASLSIPVMTRSGRASLSWNDPRGWLGETTVERQLYDDNNAINTAYAWLLAPVAKGQSGIVQIGYSFAAQDAEHTRWQIAQPVQPYPITDDRVRTNGRYVPYYTPLNLLSHSILGAATTHPTSRVTFHLDGSFAVRATDDAPVIVVVGTTPADASLATTTWKRSFNPWTGRGALDIASSSALSLGVAGEVMHTAYYTGTIVRLQATFRFAGSAKSRPVR